TANGRSSLVCLHRLTPTAISYCERYRSPARLLFCRQKNTGPPLSCRAERDTPTLPAGLHRGDHLQSRIGKRHRRHFPFRVITRQLPSTSQFRPNHLKITEIKISVACPFPCVEIVSLYIEAGEDAFLVFSSFLFFSPHRSGTGRRNN